MEQLRFKSFKTPDKIMYVWTKSHYDVPNTPFYGACRNYVANTAFQFDTYGDGETQHSPMWLVAAKDIEDYVISLGLYVSENQTKETYDCLRYANISYTNRETVEFLRSLKSKNKNDKKAYYSLIDRLKSTAEKKQHDKRWEAVPDNYEASFEDIFHILCPSYFGLLDRLYLTEQIREFTNYNLWVDYEKLFEVSRESQIFTGLWIIKNLIQGMSKLDHVSKLGESLRYNIGLKTG